MYNITPIVPKLTKYNVVVDMPVSMELSEQKTAPHKSNKLELIVFAGFVVLAVVTFLEIQKII
ncbi:uncharacterized protein CELE_F23A7.1 [Caenorhabditis elegans]|uniref:Conserved domain protein n=1 Tax=Caenorhabditis elegans TaxID=6239 RepID=Q93553_CAEEL|nr:uncharacterized protein CELE_F23A7.1 [Caenorhabditis elegans]CAB02975.1 Conserved domain protein [Caenorhabditis elegans]|eukprot:NP_510642.1 Uncharacterized protein CELE_F23A7.1 [Caenorhabditis elegans]